LLQKVKFIIPISITKRITLLCKIKMVKTLYIENEIKKIQAKIRAIHLFSIMSKSSEKLCEKYGIDTIRFALEL